VSREQPCLPGGRGSTRSRGAEAAGRAPSVCILATFASLMPLIAHSSFLVECARDSTVLMPPSLSFFMSAAATPSSCASTLGLERALPAQRAQHGARAAAPYLQLLYGVRPGLLLRILGHLQALHLPGGLLHRLHDCPRARKTKQGTLSERRREMATADRRYHLLRAPL